MLFMITHACKDPKAARERWTNTEEKWDGLELVARYHAIGNTGVVIGNSGKRCRSHIKMVYAMGRFI